MLSTDLSSAGLVGQGSRKVASVPFGPPSVLEGLLCFRGLRKFSLAALSTAHGEKGGRKGNAYFERHMCNLFGNVTAEQP